MRARWTFCIVAIALLASVSGAHAQARAAGSVDSRVEALLKQMTIEEKIAQMTQLTIQAVSKTHGTATVAHELDSVKLDSAVVQYKIGSLLNVFDVAFTPQHWSDVINAIQRMAAQTRLKIPVIYGIDAVHGDHYMVGSTLFPQNIALAARRWIQSRVDIRSRTFLYDVRVLGSAAQLSAGRTT